MEIVQTTESVAGESLSETVWLSKGLGKVRTEPCGVWGKSSGLSEGERGVRGEARKS